MISPLLTTAVKSFAVTAGTVFATSQASKELSISASAIYYLSCKLLFQDSDMYLAAGVSEPTPVIHPDYDVEYPARELEIYRYSSTREVRFRLVKHGVKFAAIAFLAKKILGPELKAFGLKAWGVGSKGLKASRLPEVFKWTVEKIPSPIKNFPILGRVFN